MERLVRAEMIGEEFGDQRQSQGVRHDRVCENTTPIRPNALRRQQFMQPVLDRFSTGLLVRRLMELSLRKSIYVVTSCHGCSAGSRSHGAFVRPK